MGEDPPPTWPSLTGAEEAFSAVHRESTEAEGLRADELAEALPWDSRTGQAEYVHSSGGH